MDFTYSIRPATPDDAEIVVEMIEELANYEKMLDQCKLTPQQFREDGFGNEPFFHCLIVEVTLKTGEVKVGGYALFNYVYSTFKGKNVYLEDVYVREQYRKHGIGGDLMKIVAKMAIEKGCVQYRLACIAWNTPALKFYKSNGARDITDIEDWHFIRLEETAMHNLAAKLGNSS